MPLIKSKSKKALSTNIATEMDAGKPQNQAIAIAYDVKRKAARKKYASGGLVDQEDKAAMQQVKDEMRPILKENTKSSKAKDRYKPLYEPGIIRGSTFKTKSSVKMADGGEVAKPGLLDKAKDMFHDAVKSGALGTQAQTTQELNENRQKEQAPKDSQGKDLYAEGGEVEDEIMSIADKIMRKRKQANDIADLEANNEEVPAQYFEALNEGALKENYDDIEVSQPQDSNQHSVEIDSDKHDMIEAIRRKMRSKSR